MPLDLDRLSKRLWTRDPERPARFLFLAPDTLVVEPVTEAGRAAFGAAHAAHKGADGLVTGVLLPEPAGTCVFVGRKVGADFLPALAAFVRARHAEAPALFALAGAGAAQADLELGRDDAIGGLRADAFEVARAPELWDGLLEATTGTVAAVLAGLAPGDRAWCWVDPTTPDGLLPLLLQPIAGDPDCHRLDALVRQLVGDLPVDAVHGVATLLEDGRVQLVGRGVRPGLADLLGRWVDAEVGAHPALARLRGLRLVRTGARGDVLDVWESAGTPPAPPDADTALAALAVGEEAWFWLSGGERPRLEGARVDADPDGAAFLARADALDERFAGVPTARGIARRLDDGLLLATEDPPVEGWERAVAGLGAVRIAHGADAVVEALFTAPEPA